MAEAAGDLWQICAEWVDLEVGARRPLALIPFLVNGAMT